MTKGSGKPERNLKQTYASEVEAEVAAEQEIKKFEAQEEFTAEFPDGRLPSEENPYLPVVNSVI